MQRASPPFVDPGITDTRNIYSYWGSISILKFTQPKGEGSKTKEIQVRNTGDQWSQEFM